MGDFAPEADILTADGLSPQPPLPVRRLHNYLYCPRLFYYQWVENVFVDSADTVEGKRAHRNVDAPSRVKDPTRLDLPEGSTLRSLKLESRSLGLVGVIDIVEDAGDGAEIIDYKKGAARRDENGERCAKDNDAMQVVAYALLLEEHGVTAARGWIYYGEERRRVPVTLNAAAFAECRLKIDEAKALAASGKCPPPLKDDPRCLHCSAYPICLPDESLWWARTPEAIQPDPQSSFPFATGQPDTARGHIPGAIDFAAAAPRGRTVEAPRPAHDDGEVLVVQTPGARVGVRGERLIVTHERETLAAMPGRQVRAVYLYGAVQLTAQAVATCLDLRIGVAWFSAAGRYLGSLQGLPTSGTDARRGQYRLFELPGIRLRLAKAVIESKVRNQRVMLMRNGNSSRQVLKAMAGLRDAAGRAENIDELLGIEGASAALYFERFPSMLKGEEGWAFDWKGRNRRPPRDPVNALLSLGYSMLAKELTGICHAVGLDPFLGFMHRPRYGRPALALDLMEEFRPLISDSVAVSLINRRELGPEDFLHSAGGTFLNERGRKAFWESWFRRMDTEVRHPEFGYRMAYRRMMEVQARQLWRFLRGEAATYHAFHTR